MKTIWVCLVALIVTIPPATSRAATVAGTNHFPKAIHSGEAVSLVGTFDPAKKDAVIKLYLLSSGALQSTLSGTVSANEISFRLPEKVAPDRYYVTLDYDDLQNKLVPGELRVEDTVQLDAAHPTTAYRNAKGSYDFAVIGQNFSLDSKYDQIYIAGQGPIIRSQVLQRRHFSGAGLHHLPSRGSRHAG